MPGAYGARESALSDLNNPNYYSSFQPTSFEQALGAQNFQNIWPEQEAYLKNILSQSGMSYSPVAATTLGRERGNLSTQIGSYLSDQGNQRATNSLNARLGIDPMSQMLNPYMQVGAQQGNAQANSMNQYNQQVAQAQYQQQMNKYNQNAGLMGTLGTVGGAGLGFLVGGPAGMGIGASLGNTASGAFGGASGGQDLGQSLALYQMMQGQGQQQNQLPNGWSYGSSVNPMAVSSFGGGVNQYQRPRF